ncbi:MAG: ATP-dependent Clp protease ATP-binding subunit, partial [Lewinella sp.]|nr:ATP-dependent Clp protease ATP-binding subunit [Lewinella sp.]
SAKALADYFFGQGQKKSPLIRIDMSEFQHPGQLSRLIGSGREVGQLVKEVRERPFAVILLDEIEKAAPSIFDALLTLLDEGLMVDAFGRLTDFRNTIIIMTSNLGASTTPAIGFQGTDRESTTYRSAIEKHFRPEFINRIDSVVYFNSINSEDLRKITLKELKDLSTREGFTKRNLQLIFNDPLVDHLVSIGFDKRYGARPLQRAIEQAIVKPMSYWLLEHNTDKATKLQLNWDGRLIIEKV